MENKKDQVDLKKEINDLLLENHPSSSSQVNHPNHYGGANNTYEAIKVIEAWEYCKVYFSLG